jgi:hypothetical protein
MRRLLPILLIALTVACGKDSSPTAPSTPATPTPTPAAPTVTAIAIGGACQTNTPCNAPGPVQLSATALLSNGTSQTVTTTANWSSTNGNVATVNGTGAVAVHNQGQANIVATYQGQAGGTTVVVPAPWNIAGTGDTVFDMPTYVSRVTIVGDYGGNTSNFIVHIAGNHIVNELVGTFWSQVHFQGTYVTTGGTVEILSSSGVRWSFLQVRQ